MKARRLPAAGRPMLGLPMLGLPMLGLALLLLLAVVLSLTLGARPLPLASYLDVIRAPDPADPDQLVLTAIRLPRLVAGLVAGAALGLAGMVMQEVTRNPLADPGLLGVNAGASFSLLAGSALLGQSDAASLSLLTLPGAALTAAAVFLMGGGMRGDADPVRLTLAGAATNAFLLSLVTAVILLSRDSQEVFRFWVAGSLAQAGDRPLAAMALLATAGAAVALLAAPLVEALSLGAALSRGLGTRPALVQGLALLAVTLTTGAAVAVAGPLAFLGLVAPPLARLVAGQSLRPALVASAAFGATILLLADTAGRLVLAPAEVRAGVMTALIGGPVFLLIARRLRPGRVAA